VRAVRSPPALLLPDVVESVEGLAPIEVLPLVDVSELAVLPLVPLVEPDVELLVPGDALGVVVVALLSAPGVLGVMPPSLAPEPAAPDDPDDAPAAPDEPLAPEPAPPEL
jgi:hypothetical protein